MYIYKYLLYISIRQSEKEKMLFFCSTIAVLNVSVKRLKVYFNFLFVYIIVLYVVY